ncbi:MAG: membrane protein insertion efficiency factor YidD [bacterium]
MRSIVIFLIRGYKLVLSPVLGQNCRFHPSCSSYSIDAIRIHGVIKGGALSLRRILKCQPMNSGGYDPVPDHFSLRKDDSECAHNSKQKA